MHKWFRVSRSEILHINPSNHYFIAICFQYVVGGNGLEQVRC
jgi:hypothetical protein